MKKLFLFSAAVVAAISFVSCNKENSVSTPERVRVTVSTELPIDANTKVAIDESGSNFILNWQGTETFGLANSTNNTCKSDWVVDSYIGTSAVLTGSSITVTGETTNWFISNNLFSATNTAFRVNLPAAQLYNGGDVAQNCLLAARADDASTTAIPSVTFKTMNAFLKLSLTKGEAELPSTNDYTKMYVQNIVVEAIGDEDIAGRFELSKTAADWMDAYSGTVAGQMSSKITLDCTAINAEGEELSAVAKDFYIAAAFGTYASGLKVTVNVLNQDGDAGTYERTIGTASGITLDRNTLLAMPALTVNPTDAVAPDTYTLVTDPSDIVSGEKYLIAALRSGNYHIWTGSITTTSNKDMITASYSYNTTTGVLTGDGAVEVTLTSTGVKNQYYVMYDSKYLGSSAASNRRITLNTTVGSWTFGTDTRGGMTMGYSGYDVWLLSSTADSNVLRTYTANTNGAYGVYLFHKD